MIMHTKARYFKKFVSYFYENKGVTLIDVAVGMLILGLLSVPALKAYDIWLNDFQISTTQGAMEQTTTMVNIYFQQNRRYPLPASLLAREGDANFGVEQDLSTNPPSACPIMDNGYCVSGTGDDAILIGAVPTATLGMTGDFGLDYWRNKIFYVVTRRQTDAATFELGAGRIREDSFFNPPDGSPAEQRLVSNQNDMVMISTGASGKGGYTSTGY
jgi:Tfp pilus assembly protein PilE